MKAKIIESNGFRCECKLYKCWGSNKKVLKKACFTGEIRRKEK